MDNRLHIAVDGDPGLHQAGMERLAGQAGFDIVTTEAATVRMRGPDQPSTSAPVEIIVEIDTVRMSVRQPVDPQTWMALLAIVNGVLDLSTAP